MATDGIKIIDGDTAHDTYWGIMDLYDSGADFSAIEKTFPLETRSYFDDFDNEIYITCCALAYWEIGQMTNDKLKFVEAIIEKRACEKVWSEYSQKEGNQRKKELDRFFKKISQIKNRTRARKKYHIISDLFFQPDNLLTFKLQDGNYRVVICVNVKQYKGKCDYLLVPTTYNSDKKPTIEDLKDKEILGTQMDTDFSEGQPEIEKIWKDLFGSKINSFLGIVQYAVNHKNFDGFKDRFEKIGSLKIKEEFKRTGSLGYEENFERFEDIFSDLENHIKIFKYKKYPITVLCDI